MVIQALLWITSWTLLPINPQSKTPNKIKIGKTQATSSKKNLAMGKIAQKISENNLNQPLTSETTKVGLFWDKKDNFRTKIRKGNSYFQKIMNV